MFGSIPGEYRAVSLCYNFPDYLKLGTIFLTAISSSFYKKVDIHISCNFFCFINIDTAFDTHVDGSGQPWPKVKRVSV